MDNCIHGRDVRNPCKECNDEIRRREDFERRVGPPNRREAVEHPAHYGGNTRFEVIKIIESFGLGFCLGNALKYLLRAGKKSDAVIEDTKKAVWYLKRARDNGESLANYGVESSMSFDQFAEILVAHGVQEHTPLARAVSHILLYSPYAAQREAEAHLEELQKT